MIRVRFKIRIRVGEFPSINTVAGGTGGYLSDNEKISNFKYSNFFLNHTNRKEGKLFYLTTHSHFIYSYMASVIW